MTSNISFSRPFLTPPPQRPKHRPAKNKHRSSDSQFRIREATVGGEEMVMSLFLPLPNIGELVWAQHGTRYYTFRVKSCERPYVYILGQRAKNFPASEPRMIIHREKWCLLGWENSITCHMPFASRQHIEINFCLPQKNYVMLRTDEMHRYKVLNVNINEHWLELIRNGLILRALLVSGIWHIPALSVSGREHDFPELNHDGREQFDDGSEILGPRSLDNYAFVGLKSQFNGQRGLC